MAMMWADGYSPQRNPNMNKSKPKPKSKSAPKPKANRPQTRSQPNYGHSAPAPPPNYSSGSVPSVTPPRPKPPKPPSLKSFLAGDEAYQQGLRGGKRTLNDFLSELTRRRGEHKTQFGQTRTQMETDRTRQLEAMKNEFASRGLIHSGLYGQEQGRFNETFQQQMSALEQQFTALLADLTGEETNMRRQNDLAMEQARQEAIARRASRYNL